MDKVLLKFFADVLYLKEELCSSELEDIYDAKTPSDLDNIFEKMIRGEYNDFKRGESYGNYGKHGRSTDEFNNDIANENAEIYTSVHDGAVHECKVGSTS